MLENYMLENSAEQLCALAKVCPKFGAMGEQLGLALPVLRPFVGRTSLATGVYYK